MKGLGIAVPPMEKPGYTCGDMWKVRSRTFIRFYGYVTPWLSVHECRVLQTQV